MDCDQIEIMPTARNGLIDIAEYIALDNPKRAISFIDEITGSLANTLSTLPYSGSLVNNLDIEQEIRVYCFGNYNTYYRVVEQQKIVQILFIFHASRDIQALLTGL